MYRLYKFLRIVLPTFVDKIIFLILFLGQYLGQDLNCIPKSRQDNFKVKLQF